MLWFGRFLADYSPSTCTHLSQKTLDILSNSGSLEPWSGWCMTLWVRISSDAHELEFSLTRVQCDLFPVDYIFFSYIEKSKVYLNFSFDYNLMTICSGINREQPWFGIRGQHNQTRLRTKYAVFTGTWRRNIVGKNFFCYYVFRSMSLKKLLKKTVSFSEMMDKILHILYCLILNLI